MDFRFNTSGTRRFYKDARLNTLGVRLAGEDAVLFAGWSVRFLPSAGGQINRSSSIRREEGFTSYVTPREDRSRSHGTYSTHLLRTYSRPPLREMPTPETFSGR